MTCQRAERIWPLGRLITPVSWERSLTKAPDTRMPLRDFVPCQPGPVHSGGHLSKIHSAVGPKNGFSGLPRPSSHGCLGNHRYDLPLYRLCGCRLDSPVAQRDAARCPTVSDTTSLAITCTPNTCKGKRRRFFPQPLTRLITSVPLDG